MALRADMGSLKFSNREKEWSHSMSKLKDALREFREEDKPKKELIILAFYMEMGNLSDSRAMQRLKELKEIVNQSIKGIEEETNYKVHAFVLPTKGPTKVECIFPKEPDEKITEYLQEVKEEKLLP